jgi:hypothetical protein
VLRLFGDLSDDEKREIGEKDKKEKEEDKIRRENLRKAGILQRKKEYGGL